MPSDGGTLRKSVGGILNKLIKSSSPFEDRIFFAIFKSYERTEPQPRAEIESAWGVARVRKWSAPYRRIVEMGSKEDTISVPGISCNSLESFCKARTKVEPANKFGDNMFTK